MTRIFKFYLWLDHWFTNCIRWLLLVMVVSLGGMIFMQVVLRNVFNSGVLGVEVVSRNLVLWIAFLGAMLGTRARQHINIDMFPRLLPHRARNILRVLLDALSCVVTFYLAKAAYTFVVDEKLMGEMMFGSIPTWCAQVIMPFGFFMISFEYAVGVVLDVRRAILVGDVQECGDWRKYISM